MARDRVYTSSQYREVVDGLKKNDVLGLNIVEGKDIFMLAVALGLDNPTQLKNKIGLFLNTAYSKQGLPKSAFDLESSCFVPFLAVLTPEKAFSIVSKSVGT